MDRQYGIFHKLWLGYKFSLCIAGLPKNFALRDYRPPTDVPCIIMLLCEKHEGLQLEAKSIKEHWWKPHIKKLFDKKVRSFSSSEKIYRLSQVQSINNNKLSAFHFTLTNLECQLQRSGLVCLSNSLHSQPSDTNCSQPTI